MKSSDLSHPYRVESSHFQLRDFGPAATTSDVSKDMVGELLNERLDHLKALQQKFSVQDLWAFLLIIQGMDGSGKNSVIRHVLSGISPEFYNVHSFKPPSNAELNQDYMWRCAICLPARGRLAVFNRSYYEEVLTGRVFGKVLQK